MITNSHGRQFLPRVVEVVRRQNDLLEIVHALVAAGRLARGLDGRKQQRNKNADDGNDDKKLDKGKTV
jgi:hypothetical protein